MAYSSSSFSVSRERRTENSARESTDAVERGPKSLTCSSKTINLQLGFTWIRRNFCRLAHVPPEDPGALYIICMTHVHAWAFEKSDGGADCEFSNLVCTQRWLILRLPGNRHFFTHLARTPTPTLPGAVCAANACRSRRGLKKIVDSDWLDQAALWMARVKKKRSRPYQAQFMIWRRWKLIGALEKQGNNNVDGASGATTPSNR